MKSFLELYLVTAVPEGFHYVLRQIDISQEHRDPDYIATEYLEFLFANNVSIVEKDRYILHSTSWRYENPNHLILTYVAYADSFSFAGMNPGLLKLGDIEITETSNPRIPRPIHLESKAIISHGIRHLAFLVSTDKKAVYRKVLNARSTELFRSLDAELAGRIAQENAEILEHKNTEIE